MLQRSDLTFSVPSSGRAKKCVRMVTTLLPSALVFVAEREADDYLAAGLPPERLRTHPNLAGMGRIRNHLVQACTTPALVMVDDDFESVLARPGKTMRKITRPDRLLEIAYSTALVASDMGVSMFGWGVQPFPMYYKDSEPMTLKGPFGGAIGFIGKQARYDDRLQVAEDGDVILRELLYRRIVHADKRFYWNFGKVAGGVGGLQTLRTPDSVALDRALLRTKWGSLIQIDEEQPGVHMTHHVRRKQAWAAGVD